MMNRSSLSVGVFSPHVRHLAEGICISIAAMLAGASPASEIEWRDEYEAAEREARFSGRSLWLQFTGSWCGFCRKMERETFSRPEVVSRGNQAFIPVKIEAEQRPDLMERFGVSGLPATILIEPTGRIAGRHEGFAEAAEFLMLLGAVRDCQQVDLSADNRSEIALSGFDPVRLVEGHGLAAGRPELSVDYDGMRFRFSDNRDRSLFLTNPDRFLPVAHGRCPVSLKDLEQLTPGDPRYGVYYQGRLYLCVSEDARTRFAANPDRYANVDLAEGGYCPHCRTLAGREVLGRPEFASIHRGRRYLFPDADHRAAFRESPDSFVRR